MASPSAEEFDENNFYQGADAFFASERGTALTYDDVSLATNYSEILPRDANLETQISERIGLNIPIISSDMDTVTEYEMAIAMASAGGMGIIHYNMPYREQVSQVTRVKYHINGLLPNPITVQPDIYIGDVLDLIDEKGYKFQTFPVTEVNGTLVGLLSSRVVKERYRHIKVCDAMDTADKVLTLSETEIQPDPIGVADRFFSNHLGINKLLVVDNDNKLIKEFKGGGDHFGNFIQAVRSRNPKDLNADILEGHLSSALCHTGNISHRVGKDASVEDIRDVVKKDDSALEAVDRMIEYVLQMSH